MTDRGFVPAMPGSWQLEDEPTGVRWNTRAAADRILAMMAPLHLAKVEAAKRAGRRMVGGLTGAPAMSHAGKSASTTSPGASAQRGGGSSIRRVLVVDGDTVRSRRLSPREAARVMGLSDDNYDADDLVGDGVAVPVVRHLAEHILEPILRTGFEPDG